MTMSQAANHPDGRIGDGFFPPASLGVIGSGQLGRMFIQAAQRMGYRVGVLSATEETPAVQVANWTVIGPPDHLPALRAFAERTEAVTVEFENVSAPACAGWPAGAGYVRDGGLCGPARTGSERNASWPGTGSLTLHGDRCVEMMSSLQRSATSGCR